MTRIIAGRARGRRLVVPNGRGTRPTSDRAREGLFSALESLHGPLAGARVLDLYAGSGAVGLEALSRGASATLLVESDQRAVRCIRENSDRVGLPGAEVVVAKAERLVSAPCSGWAFDIVFLDPPYELPDGDVAGVLRDAAAQGWLAREAVVVVERATRGGGFAWPDGFRPARSRRYGEGTLWYGRRAPRRM
ncbi:MAG: 16S rRNA (guanine(966)-N(2))-methyltransferase RsmD [Carbonactinosporaceae bacterium]